MQELEGQLADFRNGPWIHRTITAQIIKLTVSVRRMLSPPTLRLFLVFVVPYALAVSIITSVGPLLQQHVLEVLDSNAPSLYEAVYDNALARFPKLIVWLGAIIRFKSNQTKTEFSSHDAKIKLDGASGWFSVDEIKSKRLENSRLGETGFLSFHGNVNSFRVNGARIDASEYEKFIALGDLSAQYLREGKISITGSANILWRNDERLNPTKWELMSEEAKLALIPVVLSLGGLFEFCRREINKRIRHSISGTLE